MREIRFRQPIFNRDGTFNSWHYWGWISEGNFVSPLSMGHNVKGEFGQQFTGLHDKNGKEIYEGDVLRFNGEYPMNLDSWMGRRFWEKTGYVYYDDKESRFTCTEMGNQVSTSYWIACSKEVIGNIYEHPELLKET